jgi:hypothetical protein
MSQLPPQDDPNPNPSAGTDDKKWATAIAASIVSGGVGFITGSKAVG